MVKRILFTNLVFIIFTVILLFLSVVSYQRINQQAQASNMVDHTYLVKLKLQTAFTTLLKAESAQRGYIITSDKDLLNKFIEARNELPLMAASVDSLLIDNPEQVKNMATTKRLFRARLVWLQNVIDVIPNVTTITLDSLFTRGTKITDSIAAQIALMSNAEDRLLSMRLSEKLTQEKRAASFVLLFSIFSLIVVFFAYLRLKGESNLLKASITDNTVLESMVDKRTGELRSANEKLNVQNDLLERKNAELNSFTFIASHDLKEPLRKIEIYTNKIIRADEDHLTEDGKNNLRKVSDSIQRMKNLIDSIFSYAQIEQELEYEKTDLAQIAADALNNLSEKVQEKNARIDIDELPVINAVPEQMEQLFTNLISNSLKYTQPGKSPLIEIKSEKQFAENGDNCWKIIFSDNGIGFDELYKEKIFQIFQRAHSKSQYPGTGIGLAICRKIVENHHGHITAKSVPGQGSIFTIMLPENFK